MSNIEKVIRPTEKDLGDDFIVRRSIPQAGQRSVGPFVFWDHMGPTTLKGDKELKVRSHPHIGLATITYLFSGEILHRDSLNNEQPIRPGEVNWMTAGKGIVHSERARSEEAMQLEGIQLWVALPVESEEVEPSFVHEKEADLPMVESDGVSLRLIAGKALGEKSPLPVYSPLFYLNGKGKAGTNFSFPLEENHEAALYIISGSAVSGENVLRQYDMPIYQSGTTIELSLQEDCEFMLFGGAPFPEKRTVWWNFVSSKKERIEEAKKDWIEQKFPAVINETEFIPLPEE